MNKVMRTPEIKELTGLSESTISRMEKRGDFPQRKKIGVRAVGWLESDVKEWLGERKAKNFSHRHHHGATTACLG